MKPESLRDGRDKKCGTVGVGGRESAPKLSTVSTMGEEWCPLVIEFSSSEIEDILILGEIEALTSIGRLPAGNRAGVV